LNLCIYYYRNICMYVQFFLRRCVRFFLFLRSSKNVRIAFITRCFSRKLKNKRHPVVPIVFLTITDVDRLTSVDCMSVCMHKRGKRRETPGRSVLLNVHTEHNWGEKNEKKKKKGKEKRRGNFDKSLASQPLCSRDMVAEKKSVCQ
jgi:hypothetical protein